MTSINAAYADYSNLVDSLNVSKYTVYEDIMAKEKNRIDLINRVVDQNAKSKWTDTIFYNKTAIEIAISFADTLRLMFAEVLAGKVDFDKLLLIFYEGDRKIYSGMMLLLVGFFLYFVDASS